MGTEVLEESGFAPMFSAPEPVRRKARQWDQQLKPLGLSVRILLERSGSTTIYVYRRKQSERLPLNPGCRKFLEQAGYEAADPDRLLEQLALCLQTQPDLPREIGIFVGYPLRDVIGFIENRGLRAHAMIWYEPLAFAVKGGFSLEKNRKKG